MEVDGLLPEAKKAGNGFIDWDNVIVSNRSANQSSQGYLWASLQVFLEAIPAMEYILQTITILQRLHLMLYLHHQKTLLMDSPLHTHNLDYFLVPIQTSYQSSIIGMVGRI